MIVEESSGENLSGSERLGFEDENEDCVESRASVIEGVETYKSQQQGDPASENEEETRESEDETRENEDETRENMDITEHDEIKAMIHVSLKRAKIYVVRNLLQRIAKLKSTKGSEAQIAKKLRKTERIAKVIDTLKQFIIATLTERTIAIFEGSAEKFYLEMWKASSESNTVESLIDTYMKMDGDEKFAHIAYLRMLSCKGVHQKLETIAKAVTESRKLSQNLWIKKRDMVVSEERKKKIEEKLKKIKERNKRKRKEKKKEIIRGLRREKRKLKNNSGKSDKKRKEKVIKSNNTSIVDHNFNENTDQSDTVGEIPENHHAPKSIEQIKKIENINNTKTPKIKTPRNDNSSKVGMVTKNNNEADANLGCDDFFMDNAVISSEQPDSDKSDQEFCAPVTNEKPVGRKTGAMMNKKKNRMGQRMRRKLVHQNKLMNNDRRYNNMPGNANWRNGDNSHYTRNSNDTRFNGRKDPRSRKRNDDSNGYIKRNIFKNETVKTPEPKKVDEKLHPSWQAKQRLKSQQGLTIFTGTKITFD